MKPEIVNVPSKKLIGKSKMMSLGEDATRELWQSFVPHRNSIPHRVDEKLYNMKVFKQGTDVRNLNLTTPFLKWAAIEVESIETGLNGMETYTLQGGLYAKFLHRGPASRFHQTLEYIHTEWMPASAYKLDDREHFERFDEHYNPANPNSVEEVWIPIKRGTDL